MTQKKPQIRLVFPPQFEPFQPYLSLPYIKGLLKIYDIDATCFDANIDFYWWLFKKGQDANMISCPRKRYLFSNVTRAIEIMRAVPQNLLEYRWAVNVADEYLKAISPPNVKISLTFLTIGNKYSSDDLRNYLQNKDNIFRDYFTYAEKDILGPPNVKLYMFSLAVLDQLGATITFAREVKIRRPNAKIIIGGPLISHLYQQLIKVSWIHDLFDIIAPSDAHGVLSSVFGLRRKLDGHVTPDFNDLDLHRYFSSHLVLPYLISHGCKWGRCTFCSHHLSYKDYRESDMKSVVDDLRILSQKYGAKYISFSDEYLPAERLDQLANLIAQNNLDIKWSTFARAEPRFADMDFTKKLYNAGCRMLMFGFESASQRVLNLMRKGIQVKYFAPILESCKNANIVTRLDFMLGFPHETEEEVQETFLFIKKNTNLIDTPFSSYAVAVFELRDGTPIINEVKRYGIKPVGPLRGVLDEQCEFLEKEGFPPDQKRKWRHKMIRYAKSKLSFELITPQNKTHQLILKDLYDEGCFPLPVTRIEPNQLQNLWGIWCNGVTVSYDRRNSHIRVLNYATGGELVISSELTEVIQAFKHGTQLYSAFLRYKDWDPSTFIKLLNFLCRNDYLLIGCPRKVIQEDSRLVRLPKRFYPLNQDLAPASAVAVIGSA